MTDDWLARPPFRGARVAVQSADAERRGLANLPTQYCDVLMTDDCLG
jgi:hypothetical protein